MTGDACGFAQSQTDGSGNHNNVPLNAAHNTESGIIATRPTQAPKGASCFAAHIANGENSEELGVGVGHLERLSAGLT